MLSAVCASCSPPATIALFLLNLRRPGRTDEQSGTLNSFTLYGPRVWNGVATFGVDDFGTGTYLHVNYHRALDGTMALLNFCAGAACGAIIVLWMVPWPM